MKRTQVPDLELPSKPDALKNSQNLQDFPNTATPKESDQVPPAREILPALESEVNFEQIDQTNVSKSPSLSKRNLLWVMGAIAGTILGATGGWHWWQFEKTHITTENAQIQGHLSPISCKISATVERVLVKEGDFVKAGQTVITLGNQDLALNLQQAQAKLLAAQAQVQTATDTIRLTSQTNRTQVQESGSQLAISESSIRAAQADINQVEASIAANRAKVAQAQTEVTKTQSDLRRYNSLLIGGAVSAQQAESVKASYDNALANLAAANRIVEQSLAEKNNALAQLQKAQASSDLTVGQAVETKVAGQKVLVDQDQRQIALAQVAQAKADLALVKQQLDYTVIKAPVSGYVGKLTAQVGQTVQAGEALMSVVPLETDQIYVEANFKETALQNLRIGQSAAIEVDSYSGEVFQATVAGISPATGASFALLPPDNATGNYNKVVQWLPVRLAFRPDADPNHKLRAGLSVKVIVDAETGSKE